MHRLAASMSIALAAFFWGLIALFVRELKMAGFTSMEIVTIRVVFAFLFLLVIGLSLFRKKLKMNIRHSFLFVGTGIFSIVFFNWCYFTTINEMNVSLAVILLYTSPAFVTVLSFILLKEKLNLKKVGAVIGTIIGCILIAGLRLEQTTVTTFGLIVGLGSGLGYALYSIFGKFALRIYEPFTVTFYTFLVATITLVPTTSLFDKANQFMDLKIALYSLGLALIPTVVAYFLYTWGLKFMESSKASILATVEPIIATFLGVFYYNETLTVIQIIGGTIILSSVILVSYEK